jgi:hypothetical protein
MSEQTKLEKLAAHLAKQFGGQEYETLTKTAQAQWQRNAREVLDALAHIEAGTEMPPF